MSRASGGPSGPEQVRERSRGGDTPAFEHPGWAVEFPWLVQGVTARPFDLRLFGTGSTAGSAAESLRDVAGRWDALGRDLGLSSVVHARQVHGSEVLVHETARPGLHADFVADGHLTQRPGLVLTVSVADCVPVYLVEPGRRVVGLVHAGWRGAAAGILPAALSALAHRWGAEASEVRVHLGPAICGRCYEVGPEVHVALGLPEPSAATPVDVRSVLFRQAVRSGVPGTSVSTSQWCTLCDPGHFFSHRGGSTGRQVAFLGLRPEVADG